MKAKFVSLLLSLLSVSTIGLASCGGTSSSKSSNPGGGQTLYVCVYDGGYGNKWIEKIASDYEAKTGVHVEYASDTSILDRIESQLKDGSDYDIFMSHDINWRSYAASGYLAELDDVYDSIVEGTDTKFVDRLCNGAAEISKDVGEDGVTEHYYKVCYTQGAGGLVYNVDLFEANGWEVPTTYDELVKLCKTISATQIPGERGNYAPFAWSGSDRQYYWDYLVFPWWCELAGQDKIDTILQYKGTDGKYSTGYEMYNPDTYYKEFIQAYKMWYDLVALNSSYSMANAYSSSLISAQGQFASEKCAMIPYGQWAQYEIEQANKSDLSFNIRMMKTPKANASTTQQYNYNVGFGDSMIIPSNSPNIDLAKDFLKYLATYDACKTFVEKSEGAFLAFDYSNVDLTELRNNDSYTDSVYRMLTECHNFNLVSNNPITYWNSNKVMPWIENKYYYQNACQDSTTNSPTNVGNNIYKTAQDGWNSWVRNAGLKD